MNFKRFIAPVMAIISAVAPFGGVAAASVDAPEKITAREAFVNLPPSVLDLLSRSTRLDMLDYFDADSLWQATNTFGGPSVLEQVTPSSLIVRLTPVSTLQVCILPPPSPAKEPVVMTLYTVADDEDASDTEISFFTPDMVPLESSSLFRQPKLRDFFLIPKGSKVKVKDLEQEVAFPTVAYRVEQRPSGPILDGSLTVSPLLSKESREMLAPYLLPSLRWTWSSGKWKSLSDKK